MKIEDQVCSLELAKRLKELGMKQDGNYFWESVGDGIKSWHQLSLALICKYNGTEVAAFTVVELGEMLPGFTEYLFSPVSKEWRVCLIESETGLPYRTTDKSEANARAKANPNVAEPAKAR